MLWLNPKAKIVFSAYRPQATDTTPEADRLQFALLRRQSLAQRAARVLAFHRQARSLQQAAFAAQHPEANDRDRKQFWIRANLDDTFCPLECLLATPFMLQTPIELADRLDRLFDRLQLAYFVGGGLASTFLGEARTTEDVDIALSLTAADGVQLLAALQAEYYISDVALQEALQGRTHAFNIIHLTSALKADIYPIRPDDEFRRGAIARRQRVCPAGSPELSFYICSAEDIVLQKLAWYRLSSRQSQKQWRDVLGVLKLQGEERLDFAYLQHWSRVLHLQPDLDRALREAGMG